MKIKIHYLFALLSLLILSAGCGQSEETKAVDRITVVKGDNQCGMPGELCKDELVIELLSPVIKGFLGGKGERYPVKGVKVLFVPLDGSDSQAVPGEAVSDEGGGVRVKLKAGKNIGDQYLKIIPVGFEKVTKTIRIISGVSITGAKQESSVDSPLTNPLEMTIYNMQGNPVKGARVYFHIANSPEIGKSSAACTPSSVLTDDSGRAKTEVMIGAKTGIYTVTAEVIDKKSGIFVRGIEIQEMGINVTGLIITVMGGLAFFIYGMKLMSDGLQLVAGDKMKTILHLFTSNRIIAVAAGATVTAVIQSSSACTVMVVGFVNAGLLNLTQAIGIIFGANIGTTMTAQMISFNIGWIALPAIISGLLILLLSKKTFSQGWAQTILGLGMLFFGMGMMGDELKLIGKFPSFVAFFKTFDCTPVNGTMPIGAVLGAIGIGTLATILIQSSSATIGIVLALASGGLINFWTAFPLVLGDNIGTTITAVLAALPTNKRARQAAIAHVLFNVIGTAIMVILFYVPSPGSGYPLFLNLINATTPGNVFAEVPQNLVRHIAMSHTIFNVSNVIVMLPFVGIIARICNFLVKIEKDEPVKSFFLEPRLLDTPSAAIEQVIVSLRDMLKEAWSMVEKATTKNVLLEKTDIALTSHLARREQKVDKLQKNITDYLVNLTCRKLTEHQAAIIPLLMHCTNDAERIADHAENILNLAKRIEVSRSSLSGNAMDELGNTWKILSDQAGNVVECLNNTDNANVKIALNDEIEINNLVAELEAGNIKRLQQGQCEPEAGIIFIEMLSELEKIGDHLSNIAERAPEIQAHHVKLTHQKRSS